MLRVRLTRLILLCFCLPAMVRAAEVIPPVPTHYFNDYANVIGQADVDQFNQQLDQFERDTSNQIVVAIYPKMQTDSDIADFTYRVKQTWHVGQKGKNNGAVLFVFMQDHKLFIQTNYGLEGALPDATCKEIIDQEITPHFKTGDYTGGLRAGINAMIAATKGEYKGNGGTVSDNNPSSGSQSTGPGNPLGSIFYFLFIAFMVLLLLSGPFAMAMRNVGGTFYQRHAASLSLTENLYFLILNILMAFSSSSRSSSGGGSGRSSGGFSGGGGTGGGGGAGGSW